MLDARAIQRATPIAVTTQARAEAIALNLGGNTAAPFINNALIPAAMASAGTGRLNRYELSC